MARSFSISIEAIGGEESECVAERRDRMSSTTLMSVLVKCGKMSMAAAIYDDIIACWCVAVPTSPLFALCLQ